MTTIETRTGTYYDEPDLYTIIEAFDEDGDVVSALYADPHTGQIMQIETVEYRRREGLATALLDFAEEHGIELFHSPEEHRTPEGNAWAEATWHIDTIDPEDAYQPAA